MLDEQDEAKSHSKAELQRELTAARESLAANSERLRRAVSLTVSPRYQIAQHPGIVAGAVVVSGLFIAWLFAGARRRARERQALAALLAEPRRRSWYARRERVR
jgi:hypothetical protein